MIEEFLQLRLDQALATCRQRWILGGAAVGSVVTATALTTVGAVSTQGLLIMIAVVMVAAVIAVSASGSHIGSLVVAVVAVQWLAFADDATSISSLGVALCLYVFHALTALAAATPHTTEIDTVVLRRWAVRSTFVGAATVIVWGLVILFDGRQADGNEALTVFGLVVIASVLVLVRRAYATWWNPAGHERGLAGPRVD